jgi:Tfp pilus assembly protein FimT
MGVTMGIMAILAAIAIPMFSVMIPDYKLNRRHRIYTPICRM